MNAHTKVYALKDLAIVQINGEKTLEFLQGQLTCDVTQVTEDKVTLGSLCNPQGRVLAIFYLSKHANDYFCLIPATIVTSFMEHLKKFAVFSKVNLTNVSDDYYLYGYLGNDNEGVASEDSLIWHVPGTTQRTILVCQQPLTSHLVEHRLEDWKLIDLLTGLASIHPATVGAVTPHMLNLPQLNAVSFNKGCYVGQEIIARTHYLGQSKRFLCQAEINQPVELQPGNVIKSNNIEAGIVIDVIMLPTSTLLLAVLQQPLEREFLAGDTVISSILKL